MKPTDHHPGTANMEIRFTDLSGQAYTTLDLPALFQSGEFDHKFGLVEWARHRLKFAWSSHTIQPEIQTVSGQFLGIGVDLNFALVDIESGKVVQNISFNSYFLDTCLSDHGLFVITQLSVLFISRHNWNEVEEIGLPDSALDWTETNDSLLVKCDDGRIVKIALQGGTDGQRVIELYDSGT